MRNFQSERDLEGKTKTKAPWFHDACLKQSHAINTGHHDPMPRPCDPPSFPNTSF